MDLGPGTGLGERTEPLYAAPPGTYRSLVRLANVAIGFLSVHILLDLSAVVVDMQMLGLLERVRDGGVATFEEAVAHDDRVFWMTNLQIAGDFVVAIPFIAWMRRAYRNLAPLGVRWLRFKPGWAIAGWFVPFIWFARPKSIVNDVWRASDPELPRDVRRPPEGAPVPRSINWWWGLWIAAGIVYPADFGARLEQSLGWAIFDVRRTAIADALMVGAGILAIVMVRKITARQEQRHAQLSREES